ncbi:MAG: hypothetical protein LBH25_13485 [Fibromonadaceae bacterium]|nr:hypothetical protein [Fibromonadaceae bacterium]
MNKIHSNGRASLHTTLAASAMLAMAFTLTSCGPSAAEIAIRSAPSVEAVKGLKDKLIWLQGNAQSGGNYVLEIDTNEKDMECGFVSSCGNLSYKGKSDITITLRGIGANRTIFGGFTIESGVTLILDENIVLLRLIKVNSGGTLIMNDGSAITGVIRKDYILNTYETTISGKIHGAGVYVGAGGTFIMKGGTISGNTIQPRPLNSTDMIIIKMAGLTDLSNINFVATGAGVYVSDEFNAEGPVSLLAKSAPSGTFIKTGGTIIGYSSDQENGNVVRSVKGNVLNGFGHAIFLDGKEPKAIDTTVGPEITINFKNGVFSEGRNEKTKPQEAIAEPVEAQMPQDE